MKIWEKVIIKTELLEKRVENKTRKKVNRIDAGLAKKSAESMLCTLARMYFQEKTLRRLLKINCPAYLFAPASLERVAAAMSSLEENY